MQKTKLKHYHILHTIPILVSIFIIPSFTLVLTTNNTSALEYQNNTNVQFTFNPTLSIDISGNLTIDNLSPGTASNSNIINVNVATNNVTGYTLSATVGNANNPSDELRHSGYDGSNNSNNNYKFTSTSTDIAELSNLEPNTWGYSYSTNTGSTWSSYSTLPLYTDTGTTLNSTTNASNDNIKFKIGAKASSTQAAGTYTNTINFYATTNQAPVTFYDAFSAADKQQYNGYYKMQDMTHSICETVDIEQIITLIDIRDGTPYMIGKAKDNNCWMIQNLRLGQKSDTLTLTQDTSNVSSEGFILNGKSLDGKFTYKTIDGTGGVNNDPQYYCTNNYGCYYNWYTATAGSGTSSTNSGNVEHSICSIGWGLPTGGNTSQFSILYNDYGSISSMLVDEPTINTENTTGKIPGFVLSGGYLSSGASYVGQDGYYWSRTSRNNQYARGIYFRPPDVMNDVSSKFSGLSIRCLAK